MADFRDVVSVLPCNPTNKSKKNLCGCAEKANWQWAFVGFWLSTYVEPETLGTFSNLGSPGRRAKWTPTWSVLTNPVTSAHVSDVVHMAFRRSNVWICGPQVNVSIQSNLFRFCAQLTLFCTNIWKKEPSFYFLSKVGSVEPNISSDFRWTLQWLRRERTRG